MDSTKPTLSTLTADQIKAALEWAERDRRKEFSVTCAQCGTWFITKRKSARFCQEACRYNWHYQAERNEYIKSEVRARALGGELNAALARIKELEEQLKRYL